MTYVGQGTNKALLSALIQTGTACAAAQKHAALRSAYRTMIDALATLGERHFAGAIASGRIVILAAFAKHIALSRGSISASTGRH